MRSDLTTSFISAKNAASRRPRQLLVFKFPAVGNVYLSDQKLGAADGLANEYQPLVESWGELQDSSGDATSADSGETRQMTLTLWNGGQKPFSDYFLSEYPENVEVELYQWFAGLAESSKALIDRFVVADPIEFDEVSRLLSLDLVSISIRYDQPCGDLLTREDWPYAADSDIGRGIPAVFGSPGKIPALKARTTQALRLKGSILANSMVLPVYENLNELQFPAAGTVLIEEEKIRYSGRTASSLTVIQRGYLSTAAEHLDKREIVSVISDHTFVLCGGPVASIANVMIDGFPAPTGIYTVRPELDPARIVFSEKPWVKKFGEATRFLEMQFDGVTAANTALQPANAYDAADLATAACIRPGHAVLGLVQTTVNKNRGEIIRAYLAVEHWESGRILSDYAEVSVSGVGVVGRLSRPNPADEIDLDADVDLDHGHSHEIGGEHGHNFADPAFTTTDTTPHPHDVESSKTVQVMALDYNISLGDTDSFSSFNEWFVGTFDWDTTLIPRRTWGSTFKVSFAMVESNGDEWCDEVKITVYFWTIYGWETYSGGSIIDTEPGVSKTYEIIGPWWDLPTRKADVRVKVEAKLTNGQFGAAYCSFSNPIFTFNEKITTTEGATSNPTTSKTASGAVVRQNVDTSGTAFKDAEDVGDLATDNRSVNINTQANPSRTVVNLFDLTNYVNFNWAWFTNRQITITYVDAGDAKAVYILHAFFDVEYVPTEVVYSEEITAEVTSLADCIRPDLAVQKLLTTRGGAAESDFDTASFAAIATQFSSRGYRLDGLIEAETTVRDAVRRICDQTHSRVFTSGGTLKMVLREGHPASKPISRQLGTGNVQLRSIKVSRQPLREIANRVQLFYKRDWTATDTSTAGFLDSVTRENAQSIEKFGLKTRADSYNFDLIRDAAMAAKVADFYLMTDAWPSTFYTFLAYLDQFDLEKEDVLSVTSGFGQMHKVPMVLLASDRIFASGKSGAINLMRIVAENLFYLLTQMARADSVLVKDALSIISKSTYRFTDWVHVLDELIALIEVKRADTAMVSETLQQVWDWRPRLVEAVVAAAAVYVDQTARQADSVVMADFPEAWSVYGFGSGGFGEVRFGGLSAWRQKSPDQISIFERLQIGISLSPESVGLVDSLYFSGGFGGAGSEGFGLSPFGL